MKQLTKGILVALEGIDGAGKSTIARYLAEHLPETQIPFIITKEPGATALGKHIRALVHDTAIKKSSLAEYLLFAADRAEHIGEIIKPALEKKLLVISDRMADSSLAYQGYGRGLDVNLIKTVNQWTLQSIKPDLVLYIKLDPKTAFERIKKRNEELTLFEQETTAFFDRVIKGFETIFANRPEVITIDGTGSPDDVCRKVLVSLINFLKKLN